VFSVSCWSFRPRHFVLVISPSSLSSSSFCLRLRHPHRFVLVFVILSILMWFVVIPLLFLILFWLSWSSFHPHSTPRAVACEAGCGQCVVPVFVVVFVASFSLSPHVFVLCLPSLHLRWCWCPSPHPVHSLLLLGHRVSSSWSCLSSSLSMPHHSTHNPPHKQLLVRLGGGWCVIPAIAVFAILPFLSSPFHSRSTPQAVAHEAGGG
jgi:hypothetical protein